MADQRPLALGVHVLDLPAQSPPTPASDLAGEPRSLQVNGESRRYFLYMPELARVRRPAPLVLVRAFIPRRVRKAAIEPRVCLFIAAIAGAPINLMPEHIWKSQDPTKYKDNPPVRSGPYKLKQAIRNQKMFIWEKDPNYWAKDKLDVKPQYVVFQSDAYDLVPGLA